MGEFWLKKRLFFRKNSLLIKIIISYIIVGTTLLSLLSVFLYRSFEANTLQQIQDNNEKMLYQSYKMTETYWVSTFGYMYQQYIGDSILTQGLEGTDLTATDYARISKQLSNIKESNNFISSIYLYNVKSDLIFSNLSTAANLNDFYDNEFLKSLDKYEPSRMPFLLPRKATYTLNGQKQNTNIVSLIFMQKDTDKRITSLLVYNLDEQVLQKVVTSEDNDKSNEIFIIDNNGIVISHPDEQKINTSMKNDEFIKKILNSDNSSGISIDTVDGRKTVINYKKWANLQWTFISVSDYNALVKKAESIQHSAIFIICFFIFISIFISLIFTNNIYVPIIRLIKKIRSNNKNGEISGVSELEYLSDTYEYLLRNIDKSNLSYLDSEVMKKIVLNQLLHSDYNDIEYIKKSLENIKVKFDYKYFVVIVFRVDDYSNLCKKNDKEANKLLLYAICNICNEVFRNVFEVLEVCEAGKDNISIIINHNESEINLEKINKTMIEVQNAVEKCLSISITGGVSNSAQDISQMWYLYDNAFECTNYRVIHGYKSIVNYTQLQRKIYVYPQDIEGRIIDSFKNIDEHDLNKNLNDFIIDISEFSYDEMQLALTQLSLVVLKCFKTEVSDDSFVISQLDFGYKSINNMFTTFDRLDKIEQSFKDIFNKILNAFKAQKDTKHADVISNIIKYIGENFSDSTISINTLAEIVSLSPNYLRTLFKHSIGISISNYIVKLRIEKTKELLIKTDYTAYKISEMVGYNNSTYFYTVFKKYCGKSPDEFRKENKEVK